MIITSALFPGLPCFCRRTEKWVRSENMNDVKWIRGRCRGEIHIQIMHWISSSSTSKHADVHEIESTQLDQEFNQEFTRSQVH